jgi:tRNA nucleotidyltransferase (CCA-adding enzyme)
MNASSLWSLNTPISEILSTYPDPNTGDVVEIASGPGQEPSVLISYSLHNMVAMGLGHLPVSTVAMPKSIARVIENALHDNVIKDVTHHLCDYFPNFFVAALYELASFFGQRQSDAYIIGGITRDMLLSNERRFEVEDVDITVEGDALALANELATVSRNFHMQDRYEQFGTAKLNYKERVSIDIASTRLERYEACGSMPEVTERAVPLYRDVIRRDFTINALALSVRDLGKVIDCHSGLSDIERRQLRVLKSSSFFEDPSRIFRLLKFWVRLGFTPSRDTLHLLHEFMTHAPSVYKGGGERIKYELMSVLSLPESPLKEDVLGFFIQHHLHRLMDTTLPRVLDLPTTLDRLSYRVTQLVERLLMPTMDDHDVPTMVGTIYLLLILASFEEDEAWHAADRMGLTRTERDALSQVLSLLGENTVNALIPGVSPPSHVVSVFRSLHPVTACIGVLLAPSFDGALEALLAFRERYSEVHIELDGDDFLAAGVPQGERLGQLKQQLLAARLDGVVGSRLDELEWLKGQLEAL